MNQLPTETAQLAKSKNTAIPPKPALSFEEHYHAICHEIEKRRSGWTISAVDFDDVKQDLLIHINEKLYQFDPTRVNDTETGLARWLQSTISRQLSNMRRDQLGRFSRPCISTPQNRRGCPFNTGGEMCSQTASGKQCAECPIYAKWEKRKWAHFAIKQTLPMENHVREAHNLIGDFQDMERSKAVIDRAVLAKLTKHEQKMYRMLFIRGMEPEKVGKALGYKKVGRLHEGYNAVRNLKKKVVALAKITIRTEGLA